METACSQIDVQLERACISRINMHRLPRVAICAAQAERRSGRLRSACCRKGGAGHGTARPGEAKRTAARLSAASRGPGGSGAARTKRGLRERGEAGSTYFADASLEQGLGREHPLSHGGELHVYSAAGSRKAAAVVVAAAAAGAAAAAASAAQTIILRSLTSALALPLLACPRTCCWPSLPGGAGREAAAAADAAEALALPAPGSSPPAAPASLRRDPRFNHKGAEPREQGDRRGAGRPHPKEQGELGGDLPNQGAARRPSVRGGGGILSCLAVERGKGANLCNPPQSASLPLSSFVSNLAHCSSPVHSHPSTSLPIHSPRGGGGKGIKINQEHL